MEINKYNIDIVQLGLHAKLVYFKMSLIDTNLSHSILYGKVSRNRYESCFHNGEKEVLSPISLRIFIGNGKTNEMLQKMFKRQHHSALCLRTV